MKMNSSGFLFSIALYLANTSAFFLQSHPGFRTQRCVSKEDAFLSCKKLATAALTDSSFNANADISTTVLVTGANGVLGRSFIR
jgi:hypothetical protein